METHARYKLIGLFSLAVILAGFVFVYWLYNTGGIRDRAVYRIEFENSVTGLLVGSSVLFNGIRVGEVIRLDLDSRNPKRVTATAAVDATTPIAPDTEVRLEFQGLTSAPVINLVGGARLPDPKSRMSETPMVLKAKPGATGSMTQAAKDTLNRIDGFIDRSSEPFHDVIANFKTFSDALAKNSDRVESVLAGIERMTGGGASAKKRKTYDLAIPAMASDVTKTLGGQLAIAEPSIVIAFNTDKILVQRPGGEHTQLQEVRWSDNIPNLIQTKIIRAFENSGYQKSVSRGLDGLDADFKLLIDIRKFQITEAETSHAQLELFAKIADRSGHIRAGRSFKSAVPLKGLEPVFIVDAMGKAFSGVAKRLIPWTALTIEQAAQKRKAEN